MTVTSEQKTDYLVKLETLHGLLEQQLELVRRGGADGKEIEALTLRADGLVQEIKDHGIFEHQICERKKNDIESLYQDLCLAIAAQKEQVGRELQQTRVYRSTLKKYRKSI